MVKQGIIVGLGQFGMSLARAMTERGVEILAVDVSMDLVQAASEFVAEALCFNATDAEALARTSPEKRDFSVCAIGDNSRESAIICTALMRQMGAKRVIGRANDEIQTRILLLVGAHEVVNPEKEFGERYANQVVFEHVKGEMPLGDDLVISKLEPPDALVGRTLSELMLPKRFGITVVAVRRTGKQAALMPDPDEPIGRGDMIVTVSREGALGKMMERL